MIGIVVAFAEVEVEDVDGVHLLDDVVFLAYLYLVVDGSSRSEKDAPEEVCLAA